MAGVPENPEIDNDLKRALGPVHLACGRGTAWALNKGTNLDAI
jgi:hypothetical protein